MLISHTISTRDVAQALRDHVRQLERRNAQLEQQLANHVRTIDRLLAQRRPTAGPEDNPADDEQPDEDDWDAWECEQTGQPPSRPRPSEIDRLHAAIVSADAALAEGRQNHFAAGAEPEPPTQLPVPTAPAVSPARDPDKLWAMLDRAAALLAEKDQQLARACAQNAKATDAVCHWREWADEDQEAALRAACEQAYVQCVIAWKLSSPAVGREFTEAFYEAVRPLLLRPTQCEDCSSIIPRDQAKGDQSLVLCAGCEHVRVSGDEQQRPDHRDY